MLCDMGCSNGQTTLGKEKLPYPRMLSFSRDLTYYSCMAMAPIFRSFIIARIQLWTFYMRPMMHFGHADIPCCAYHVSKTQRLFQSDGYNHPTYLLFWVLGRYIDSTT